jgi:hypothetical protein
MKMNLQNILSSSNSDDLLFNDKQRAIKNHRLMQWAKAATFGLYAVAIFMLYVSDLWGIASFVAKNSNDFIALIVFSTIAFTLSYFLASSKEATYEDIAIHRSEGWKLTTPQMLAMVLFASSGVLFELFSTTGNQQHIANSAAESSSLMKSIQQTDVSILGSSALTESLQKANVRLAKCQKLLSQGKTKDCVESQANLDAVNQSIETSNSLATKASEQAFNNKVDSMLKVRDSFDKPMFQAMAKYTGTDNNTGMVLVIAVLITIFELQHIMALFAYSNALRRIKQGGGNKAQPAGNTYQQAFTSPAPSASPVTPFQAMKAEFKSMVDSSPAVIANEFNRAQHAREQLYQKAADKLDSIHADLNSQPELKQAEGFKQSPAQLAKVQELYNQQLRDNANGKTYREELRNGEKVYSDSPLDKPRPAPRMSVEATVRQLQTDVKASGAASPAAIQAAVFDSYAAMQNPAPLNDAILQKISDKLIIARTHTTPPTIHGQSGSNGQSRPSTVHGQSGQPDSDGQSGQHEQPVTTVHGQSGQPELTAQARQVEADLYPEWVSQVSAKTITQGARDAKRFISQSTFNHGDKTVLSIQEMERIWNVWQERGANDGVLTANPKYQPGNRQPKYLLAAA